MKPIRFPSAFLAGIALLGIAPAQSGPRTPPVLPDLTPAVSSVTSGQYYISVEGGRKLFRFPTVIVNLGGGPLEIIGKRRSTRQVMKAYQVLYGANGRAVRQQAIGEFEFHDEHGHWHLLAVAEYRLLRPDGSEAADGNKVSFCLLDSIPVDATLPGAPTQRRYTTCPTRKSALSIKTGISVGWADVYGSHLFGQWIDVTDVPAGDYILEWRTDPEGLLQEKSETNNVATVPIQLL
jgi:lysyl oxidase